MSVVTLRNLSIGDKAKPLVHEASLVLEAGEHVCFIGRNGEGKSTLLRVMAGEISPDEGEVIYPKGVEVAYLQQDVPEKLSGTVLDIVISGLNHHELADAWEAEAKARKAISTLSLNEKLEFSSLSGGLKRRVLLAKALVKAPDLLLLDEPTNHLDIDAILWLEQFLAHLRCAIIIVSHDRRFVEKLATKIIELDRGHLTLWQGGLKHYLHQKQAILIAQDKQRAEFDKKLAKEETWLRRGVKARRARNEGRVRKLKEMRKDRQAFRSQLGSVTLQANSAEKSGKLVIDAENVSFAYEGNPIVTDFSFCLTRGDKVGILGPNGCGKSTLIQLLLKNLTPNTGEIRHGTSLNIAFFDQLHDTLNLDESVIDNVIEGSEMLEIGGKTQHVIGYLQDFLFTPEKARSKVRVLSGGERNRVLLAKLLAKPSNLLVLDEPTNDLDMESLDILENFLVDYPGCVLLVSHDRHFINNVVSSVLAFEGDGQFNEYVGGYDDWRSKYAAKTEEPKLADNNSQKAIKATSSGLSFTEKHALQALEAEIEQLEAKIKAEEASMSEPAFYEQTPDRIQKTQKTLADLQKALSNAIKKWEVLVAKGG